MSNYIQVKLSVCKRIYTYKQLHNIILVYMTVILWRRLGARRLYIWRVRSDWVLAGYTFHSHYNINLPNV